MDYTAWVQVFFHHIDLALGFTGLCKNKLDFRDAWEAAGKDVIVDLL